MKRCGGFSSCCRFSFATILVAHVFVSGVCASFGLRSFCISFTVTLARPFSLSFVHLYIPSQCYISSLHDMCMQFIFRQVSYLRYTRCERQRAKPNQSHSTCAMYPPPRQIRKTPSPAQLPVRTHEHQHTNTSTYLSGQRTSYHRAVFCVMPHTILRAFLFHICHPILQRSRHP